MGKSIILPLLALPLAVACGRTESAVTLPIRLTSERYTPDPAPVVHDGRLYVFTGHDMDTATYFRMPDWQLFSTDDMEHWTDHGIVLSTAAFSWARQGDNAWASQAIDFRGQSYLFYHDGIPSGGNGFRRSTAILPFRRGADGSIPKIDVGTMPEGK